MNSNNITLIALASLAARAMASVVHRHLHQLDKKLVHAKVDIVTDWVTVTASPHSPATTGPIFVAAHRPQPLLLSPTSLPPTSSTPPIAQSTPASSPVDGPSRHSAANSVPSNATSTVNSHSTVKSGSRKSTSTNAIPSTVGSGAIGKRGLAYNDAHLLTPFLNSGNFDWGYNWGQRPGGFLADLDYTPMLWGPKPEHLSTWEDSYKAALDAGSTHFLSFNECDNAGQCNMDPVSAAAAHAEHMNVVYTAGQAKGIDVKISSPAITSSTSVNQGISWLTQFLAACQNQPNPCKIDFITAHWYGPPDVFALTAHLLDVFNAVERKYPLWLIEYQPTEGSQDQVARFIQDSIYQLEYNASNSFVERHSYFMVADSNTMPYNLVSGTALNSYGNLYASAAA